MSLEIRIIDPANTPPRELRAAVQLLQYFMGTTELAAPVVGGAGQVLAPEDNPAAGTTVMSPGNLADEAHRAFAQTPASPPAMLPPEVAFVGNATPPAPAPIAAAPVGTPAAPAPAPVASAPQGSTGPGGVDLDAKGLPWDARIHAKSSNGPGGVKNADGTWRAKRGLNDGALVARIEAELRAAMAAPGPQTATPPASVPVPPAGNVPVPPAPVPSAPAPVVPPAAPVAPPADGGSLRVTSNYVELVQQITGAMQSNRLTEAEVVGACSQFGIASLPLLATRLDLVASVSGAVNAILAQRP